MQLAVALRQPVQVWIIERPHHDVQGMSTQRVNERAQFPASQVGRHKEHAFATIMSALVILEALVDRHFIHVLTRISWETADLRQLSAQRGKHPAQNAPAL